MTRNIAPPARALKTPSPVIATDECDVGKARPETGQSARTRAEEVLGVLVPGIGTLPITRAERYRLAVAQGHGAALAIEVAFGQIADANRWTGPAPAPFTADKVQVIAQQQQLIARQRCPA